MRPLSTTASTFHFVIRIPVYLALLEVLLAALSSGQHEARVVAGRHVPQLAPLLRVLEGLLHVLLDNVHEAVNFHSGVAVARVGNVPLATLLQELDAGPGVDWLASFVVALGCNSTDIKDLR